MIFNETKLKGAFIVDLDELKDDRGFYARAWCQKEFEAHGMNSRMVQANMQFNKRTGTLRGLHQQLAPFQEAKFVRCLIGSIFDVIVDLRPDSPSYKQWLSVTLTADNRKALFVPEGFAHGYLTLLDNTEVFYQVTEFYTPGYERGVRWDDPTFAIQWPRTENLVISEKDKSWPDFKD